MGVEVIISTADVNIMDENMGKLNKETINYDGVEYGITIHECKKVPLPHVAAEVEKRALALRLYSAGYQAGHNDTVEGQFSDDPRGTDAEYYHGENVTEILEDE